MYKNLVIFLIITLGLAACNMPADQSSKAVGEAFPKDSTDRTNDFYDNENTHKLPLGEVMVEGEIKNPGLVDFSQLPLRSVIVKEALHEGEGTSFIGAYRYDGYSLYDILNERVLAKNNAEEFPPIIDLYVEIENNIGEKVCFSWGEIFYPIHRHEVIIANRVMHIVPSKSKDLWPLPEQAKIVNATDLITCRNISNPSKITVKTVVKDFEIQQGMSPMWSESFELVKNNKKIEDVKALPEGMALMEYPNIFYGRGRGIHGVTPFYGYMLKDFMKEYIPLSQKNLKNGLITISGLDGFRGVFTVAEVMNRNDQSEVLIIDKDNYEGAGRFSLYPAGDFFSDRAIKAISDIHIDLP